MIVQGGQCPRCVLFQLQQFYILVPDLVSMVLETKEAFTGKVFDRSWLLLQFELVFLTVGTNSRFGEFVGVDFADF